MYPRLVTAKSGKYTYLRLLEKVKKNGYWVEKVLVNLGRQDIEGRKVLGVLLKKLRRFTDEVLVTPQEVETKQCREYGPFLVSQKLWQEIGLEKWINEHCGKIAPVSLGEPGVLAMVLNRLTAPRSKLALYDWMPTVYLGKWQTKEFANFPEDPTDFAEWFYRTMDWLIKGKNKEKIEQSIGDWVKTLFPAKVVFYDITNIQFEGWEKLKQARFGHIKLGRKNHKQILLGIVMVEGLPVACHIFRGNRAEKTSLVWIKEKVKKQFNVGRMIFVCDRGMISESNLLEIESANDGYIVALKRRRCDEVKPLIEKDLALFTTIKTDDDGEILLSAWEAESKEGKRRIVVFNPMRAKEEIKKRETIIKLLGIELQDLLYSVKSGHRKKIKDIVACAENILKHKNGKRYFVYKSEKDGHFEYGINMEGVAMEEKLDGKFVIKTTEQNLSLKEVVLKYKELMDVEDGFREIKDFIRVAPVFHWRYRRVKAHVFICVLSLLLERYLEQKLQKAGIQLSARKAIEKLKTIKVVDNQVGPLIIKYVTSPNQELNKILAACGIFKLPKMLPDIKRVKEVRGCVM